MAALVRTLQHRLSMLAIWMLCQIAAVIASLWMLMAIITGSRRAWTLAVAHDQLANAAFGGHEDETLSSRAGKAAREASAGPVCCVACSTGSIRTTARSPSSRIAASR